MDFPSNYSTVFNHLVSQGYSGNDVEEAIRRSNTVQEARVYLAQKKEQEEVNKAIELSLKTAKTETYINQAQSQYTEEAEISKAIENSLKEQVSTRNFAFLQNPLQRIREKDMPVGIVNIGNTCYFNSLLQAYFRLPFFAEKILQFQRPNKGKIESDLSKLPNEKKKRILASIDLANELHKLFGAMIKTKKKFVDPSSVLNALVDDYGNKISIGDQKDIGEFNINFITRISEGLSYSSEMVSNINHEGDCLKMVPDQSFNQIGSQMPIKKKLISDSLTGNTISYYSYTNKENKLEVQKAISEFSNITIFPDRDDIYDALESSFSGIIDNYKTPNGEILRAEEVTWINNLPNVLFFQIQRVQYNVKDKCLEKNNKYFEFYESINLDRFLEVNIKDAAELRIAAVNLKQRMKDLKQNIDKFKFYENSIDLRNILSASSQFLSKQFSPMNSNASSSSSSSPVSLINPHSLGLNNFSAEEINKCISILNSYKELSNISIQSLENTMEEYKKALFQNYEKMSNVKYYLYSIIVHEGSAEFGHYYTYIKDSDNGKWYKFNDININDVAYEECKQNSFGGKNSSAYYLIYVNKDTIPNMSLKNNMLRMNDGLESHPLNIEEHYGRFMPMELLKLVDEDNIQFGKEVEEYRSNNSLKNIQSIYEKKYKMIEDAVKNPKYTKFKPFNFIGYLYYENELILYKWSLLNDAVTEVCGDQSNLFNFEPAANPVHSLIKEKFQKLISYAPPIYELSETETIKLLQRKEAFTKLIINYNIISSIIEKFIPNQIQECIMALNLALSKNELEFSFSSVSKENLDTLMKTLLFKLSTEINLSAIEHKWDQVFEKLKLMTYTIKQLKYQDKCIKILLNKINNSFGKFQKLIPQEYSKKIENYQLLLSSRYEEIPLKLASFEKEIDEIIQVVRNDSKLHNFNMGWEQGIFYEFSKLYNDFMKEKLKLWYNWVIEIELNDTQKNLSNEFFEKEEKHLGINF